MDGFDDAFPHASITIAAIISFYNEAAELIHMVKIYTFAKV